jgi:hypothetical protein
MRLTAAQRYVSSRPGVRSWRDVRAFARPATSPEGIEDCLNTLEHGRGPGG